jgi:aminopeptidase
MSLSFEQKLRNYADLAVHVGLGIREGQHLSIDAPIEAAPFVRLVAERAYAAGAHFVDVTWSDPALSLLRYKMAPRDSLSYFRPWRAQGMVEAARRGDPDLGIRAVDPEVFKDIDPELLNITRKASKQAWKAYDDLAYCGSNAWCIMVAPHPAWSAKVLPEIPETQRERAMWELLFQTTRADQIDPLTAWNTHLEQLQKSCEALNKRKYRAIRFRGPGTALEVGLPDGHVWNSGAITTQQGIRNVCNIPTEEVYTLPHRERVEGYVSSTKPLTKGGQLIEGIRVEFKAGKIVQASARVGEASLQKMLDTDAGSRHLGEVALVPHSSPISQSGRVFYDTLFDENAASHIAIGRAYRNSLEGGTTMTDPEFEAAGGNDSLAHVDWMIGSGEIDVDGVNADGRLEPVMRDGEWTLG